MGRPSDTHCIEPDDPPADSPTDSPSVDTAFAFGRSGAPWWANSRIRLGVLLAGLAAAVLALLALKGDPFGFGSGPAQARGVRFARGCPGAGAPEVKSISTEDVAALRSAVSQIMPSR